MLRHRYEIDFALQNWTNRDGEWRVSKPLPGPWLKELRARIRDAWFILRGKAFAVEWA